MAVEAIERVRRPEAYRDKLIKNVTAVGAANYLEGIKHPKKDPILAGIAAEPKYKDQTTKALQNETRKKHLEFSSKELWNEVAEKRANALPEGVQIRAAKVDRFWNGWQPILSEHVTKLDTMPVGTFQDRKNKMLSNVDGLVAKKGSWLRKIS
jgi:hypothetical protein